MSRELLGQIDLNINTLYEGTYMKNVNAINFNRITNDGFIGFLCLIPSAPSHSAISVER